MMKKTPNPVDKHVGARVRMRRLVTGMTQEKLGEALGLSFQQVQKYEKGTNRIGASRLHRIASVLGVPLAFFYEGAPVADTGQVCSGRWEENALEHLVLTAEHVQLLNAFTRIPDDKVRRQLLKLAESIASNRADSAT
jgi:transcriptional regulator with XRE-family HTH domain